MRAAASPAPRTPARIRSRLGAAARQALQDGDAPLVRVEVPVADLDADLDPLAWLAAQPAARRFFWQGRGEAGTWAGAGAALVVEADDLDGLEAALARPLEVLPEGARLYGYARFAAGEPGGEAWAPFGRVRFSLPRFELREEGEGAVLALHLAAGEGDEALAAALDALAFPTAPPAPVLPPLRVRTDVPDQAGWHEGVNEALRQFAGGTLEKVVLARRSRFTFDTPLDPFALLARLRAATPGCYRVLVGEGAATFVSATPERLLRIAGQVVETEAVAGTGGRADEAASDARLHAALLASEKDRREHAYVRDAVAAALAPVVEHLDRAAAPLTLTLARGRHLYTGLRGALRRGVTAPGVLRALHPTPAVGGTPTSAALAWIRALEPFDRGLYAGPVGWIGRDAAEFAVGIRSGLVHGASLDLFSGAGIVSGSDPAAEWAEIEHKIGDFLRVLGGVG